MIAYGSIYGNTENAANILACRLADRGVRNIAVYDVSSTHPSVLVSEAFRCSHLVFASVTYNGGIFTNMERVLGDLKAHALQNRTVALMENGSWGLIAAKQMKERSNYEKSNYEKRCVRFYFNGSYIVISIFRMQQTCR